VRGGLSRIIAAKRPSSSLSYKGSVLREYARECAAAEVESDVFEAREGKDEVFVAYIGVILQIKPSFGYTYGSA
jgi:hypothetical protein